MSKYFKENDKVFVAPDGAKEIYDHLPPGQYMIRHNILIGFYLEKISSFSVPEKIFGNVESRSRRVLKTYFARNCNTGVMLSGDKGSGKTMFARLLSIYALEHDVPTVIVNDNFDNDIGLNKFISDISDRCVILFDEFEKVFDRDENQNKVLTLFDGTYQSNKLFVLTVNNTFKVSEFIINRPGRVYYHLRYNGIEDEFIREFCEYHLNDKSHTESFIRLAKVVGRFNFDMLQALVQECNIHGESPTDIYHMMNIDIDGVDDKFSYTLTNKNGKKKFGSLRTSIYNPIYMYWHGDDSDHDNDDDDDVPNTKTIVFEYSDIVKFNHNTDVLIYSKESFTLELKREKSKYFSLDF